MGIQHKLLGLEWTVAALDGDGGVLALYEQLARQAGAARFWSSQHGGTGLERLKERLPDVLLLELCLPGMDGLTLLERLRADEGLQHMHVVVISSSPQLKGLRPQLQALGVEEVLSKPFDPFRLLTHLVAQRALFQQALERVMAQQAQGRLGKGSPQAPGTVQVRRGELPFVWG